MQAHDSQRRQLIGGMAALGIAGLPGLASAQAEYVEGRHYLRLPQPIPTSVPAGKIEVLEFFSYACPHCHAFEPMVEAWAKKLPADVVFRRVPVPFLINAQNFQRLYYSLEALGQVDGLQRKVFDAVHRQRLLLNNADAIADFLASQGVDKASFLKTFNSFTVTQVKLPQGNKLVERYDLKGVPTLAVGGRFITSPSQVGGDALPEAESQTRALALTDQLIARVRKGG